MTRRLLDERGAVTAEFALALPAVAVVLALGVGILGSASATVRLQHAVTESARLLGRGDADALAMVAQSGATASVERGDGLVCVTAIAPAPVRLPLPDVTARACALDGGR
ncbi:TadE family type IV pilus minor pilin [Microbacterium sp. VKM Ac-2923]|uniref:TadE family type IV pilus minor pilin n=1 Tax=Microbacterium sp. VKM Ac-2923 TaxID=2929476 RepID=UPI001FB40E3E|nr:TadE family type IV pilus minor pilin [Microbacterium sp. VKM Ac-2923]MCJ1708644.1 TadE family protein [Microbacterium sp. VKM Ac-2923]